MTDMDIQLERWYEDTQGNRFWFYDIYDNTWYFKDPKGNLIQYYYNYDTESHIPEENGYGRIVKELTEDDFPELYI